MPLTKLTQVLIGKSILETALVGALAVVTFLTVLPPNFHGWGEATSDGIAGWAVNSASPSERVTVQLFIDGQFKATMEANLSRPDVASAGWALDEWHGYYFALPSLTSGPHEAAVYALRSSGNGARKSLQRLGTTIRFTLSPDGRLHKDQNH